jgi:hypothetical protein
MTTPSDIPLQVTDRPVFKRLSSAEDEEFLRKQAEYEAAYRQTGEPLVLFDAFVHAWWSRQTVPGWLVPEVGNVMMSLRTDDHAERYRERMRHVRRYTCVRDLRRSRKVRTRNRALDLAVNMLHGEPAGGVERETIEKSYDLVRRDLERRGRESEFFYLVDDTNTNFSPWWTKTMRRASESESIGVEEI